VFAGRSPLISPGWGKRLDGRPRIWVNSPQAAAIHRVSSSHYIGPRAGAGWRCHHHLDARRWRDRRGYRIAGCDWPAYA